MRMPRFRFTVRRMMFAVAIMAVFLAALSPFWRYARFVASRDYHGSRIVSRTIRQDGATLLVSRQNIIIYKYDAIGPTSQQSQRQQAEQHWRSEMYQKYERAARHPWLPVAPDPPEPE